MTQVLIDHATLEQLVGAMMVTSAKRQLASVGLS